MVSAAARRNSENKKVTAAERQSKEGTSAFNQQTPVHRTETLATNVSGYLRLPACVTPKQRAILHALAEQHSLQHTSVGEGPARQLLLGHSQETLKDADMLAADRMTNEELCQLLDKHLHIDARPAFAAAPVEQRSKSTDACTGSHHAHSTVSVSDFVSTTLPLLEMEKNAEVAQAQEAVSGVRPERVQARGRALLNLKLRDAEGGLLGRTLLTFILNKGSGDAVAHPLPPHKFSPHDVVDVRPNKSDSSGPALVGGLVYRVKEDCITVAVEEAPDEGLDQPLRLEKLANEVTYKRLKEAVQSLANASQQGPARGLVDVLFGQRPPRFMANLPPWTPVNTGLDSSQVRAVSLALSSQDIALVHGPPGTGKTTAIVEIILQEVKRGNKVLACAASNVAVDNLVERLARSDPKLSVVRMGHPARLLPQVLDNSLEAHVMRSDNSSLAKDCRKDIKAANNRLLKLGRKDYAERRALRSELRSLSKEEKQRQQKAVQEVLKHASVVCATLTGVATFQLRDLTFDVTVVDEAAQALEAATWAGLLKSPRAVLAGDHLQLPPTVISEEAMHKGLGQTLFERLQGKFGSSVSAMLTVQYRMNRGIMQWPSHQLYQDLLTAHPSVASHTLQDLPGFTASADDVPVLLMVDTAGCDMEEQAEEDGDSKRNEGEAKVVMAHIQRLRDAGLPGEQIGVITPYNGQVAALRELRGDREAAAEISSVDGFQGKHDTLQLAGGEIAQFNAWVCTRSLLP
ncbi:hypothetical protein ABBQ32_14187 [Trebouxia sp. C0010 RCD-2024]